MIRFEITRLQEITLLQGIVYQVDTECKITVAKLSIYRNAIFEFPLWKNQEQITDPEEETEIQVNGQNWAFAHSSILVTVQHAKMKSFLMTLDFSVEYQLKKS